MDDQKNIELACNFNLFSNIKLKSSMQQPGKSTFEIFQERI